MTEVGVLGGTFDPVHKGHLQLAAAALEEYRLDAILFVPAGRPPHKDCGSISEAGHRLSMLRLAVQGQPQYEISEIEVASSEPSYTFDTLKRLQQHAAADVHFHFIIGQDAFLEIETWYRWQSILSSTSFIIAARPGYPIHGVEKILLRNKFVPLTSEKRIWRETKSGNLIRILSKDIVDISSTAIRESRARNNRWRVFVPETVGTYIMDNKLYSSCVADP